MYVTVKGRDGQPLRRRRVLEEYGVAADRCNPEARELADCVDGKINEAVLRLKKRDYRRAEGKFDELKLAVETLSSGANTVLLDDRGMPSIMVALPAQRLCDLYGGEITSYHPAWVLDGRVKEVIYLSKYMNCVADGRAYSLPLRDPHTFFNFEDANLFCQNKGQGWHLMTNALWAAIAAWCRKNNTRPRGNTGMGYSHLAPHEKGLPTAMAGSRQVIRTASGSGPASWNHDHTPGGIADLVGNMFEWVGGLRLMDGEIQIIPQGMAMRYGRDAYAKDSRRWRGITAEGDFAAHGEKNTLKIDSPALGDSDERDHLLGTPFLSTRIQNRSYLGPYPDGNQGYLDCFFSELKAEEGLEVPLLLKILGIFPDEACTREDGIFVARNYGERIAVRGGKGGSFERGGISALHFYNPRSYDGSATVGFRCAYVSP